MARVFMDGQVAANAVAAIGLAVIFSGCDLSHITGRAPIDSSVPRYSLMSIELPPSPPEVLSVVATEPETPAITQNKVFDFSELFSGTLSKLEEIVLPAPAQAETQSPISIGGVVQPVRLTRSGIEERNTRFEQILASLPKSYDRSEWVTPATQEIKKQGTTAEQQKSPYGRAYIPSDRPVSLLVYLGVGLGLLGAILGIAAMRLHYSEE